ncbi:MAG TPA: PKD domain-containing protein, partial [Gemmatimonadales bacterium]|nr:PKD domain-containing protein [Gemmatimonadales bacterium]
MNTPLIGKLQATVSLGLVMVLAFCSGSTDNGPTAGPVVAFTPTCTGLTCIFADQTTDTRAIVSRTWDFGDGASSGEPNPTHTYGHAGSFMVALTVVDELGAKNSSSKGVTLAQTDVVFVGAGDIA